METWSYYNIVKCIRGKNPDQIIHFKLKNNQTHVNSVSFYLLPKRAHFYLGIFHFFSK